MADINNKIKKSKSKIEYFLTKFRQYWIIVLVSVIIAGVVGGIIARAIYKPEYTVTQAFTIELEANPNANSATMTDNQLSKTIPSLFSSETFMEYMGEYMKAEHISSRFKVTSLETSNIFYLTVVAKDNETCIKTIEIIDKHYDQLAENIIGKSEMKRFSSPATSSIPSNTPHYALGVIIGGAIDLVIVLGMILLKTIISKTITDSENAEKELKSRCLAVINEVKIKRRSNNKSFNTVPLIFDDNATLELKQGISALATNMVTKSEKNGYKVLMLTSTISGEGKTSICTNLACELASIGKKVLIIDCDLRSPSVFEHLKIKSKNNLQDALSGEKDLAECIVQTDIDNLDALVNTESIDFETLNISKFGKIINTIKNDYDYILIDTAPVGFLGDGIKISQATDAYIYVISYNFVGTDYVKRSLDALGDFDADMLGFVINRKH